MGYTHYWYQHKNIPAQDWADICRVARKVVKASGVLVTREYTDARGPDIKTKAGHIRLNGYGEEGHETFCLARKMRQPYDWETDQGYRFGFCKTARKPYDTVVLAILLYAAQKAPTCLMVSSDGDIDGEDGAAAWELLDFVTH